MLAIGLRIMMMKSVKALRMTRLSRRVQRRARSQGGQGDSGASNKYTFSSCKVLQIVFSQDAQEKCMYFCKLSQVCFHRNT